MGPRNPTAATVLGGFDLTDLDNFACGVPHHVFAELAAEPEWTRSNKHTGLRRVPVRVHRSAPVPVP
jgi:hypothetical protein